MISHDQAVALLKKEKLVAILRRVPQGKLMRVVDALMAGGVCVLECTFDHDQPGYIEDNCEKISAVRRAYGDALIVGCGTAISAPEVEAAVSAGAQLVISPNTDLSVIARARALGAVSIPGALTPSEIVTAFNAGADLVKLFPAGELGLSYIKAVLAPLCHIPVTAVGGVKPENVSAFLDAGVSGFGVGSPLVPAAAVAADDYGDITARANAFTQAIRAWEASHAREASAK